MKTRVRELRKQSKLTQQQLADLVHVSNRTIISIEKELDIAVNYLEIMKICHPDKFKYVIDCPKPVKKQSINKLTLQPILENAIHHGFDQMPSGGMICIAGRLGDHKVILEISDNGESEYYIGIGTGGEGQCTETGGSTETGSSITASIMPYEDHGNSQNSLTLHLITEDDTEYLTMEYDGEILYWNR